MELAFVVGLFVIALWIVWSRTRDVKRLFESGYQQLEPTARPLAIISGAVIVVVTLVFALLCGAGFFLARIGLRPMEGILCETESAAAWRQAQGLPPPSSAPDEASRS